MKKNQSLARKVVRWLVALGFLLMLLVGVDLYSDDIGYFRSGASVAHDLHVEIATAIQVFDDSCMKQTVYKVKPENIGVAFIAAGLTEVANERYANPNFPIAGSTLYRAEDEGYECRISFTSFQDIDEALVPEFTRFTDTRFSRPLSVANNGFAEDAESNNTAKPLVRSFTDGDLDYYIIFKPNNYSLNHELRLVTVPVVGEDH